MNKIDELTVFEANMAEQAAGMGMDALESGEQGRNSGPKMGLLGALAWVYVKRSEPTLTYDAYMKRTPMREIAPFLFGDDDEDEQAGFPGGAADEVAAAPDEGDGEGEVLPGHRSAAV